METVTTTPDIKLNDWMFFDRPGCLFVGRITEVREKAIKVDYALEPIFASGCNAVSIFDHTCWIPKSVLIIEPKHKDTITVKKWFEKAFKGGPRIKSYFIGKEGQAVFA